MIWLTGCALNSAGGQLLQSALREEGIALADVRIVVESPEHIAALVAQERPKLVVGFGNDVCRALVGNAWSSEGVQAMRGYMFDTPTTRVLASIHPEDITRDWTPWRALLNFDLRRAKRELAMGVPPLDQRTVTIVTHPDELWACMRDIEAMRPCGGVESLLSVDIENTHDLKLACVGFAPSKDYAYVIPAGADWQMHGIKMLCENAIPKVFQNGQYDRFFLKRFCGINVRNHAFDTQLAWHALNPELAGKKTEVGTKKAKSRRTAKSLRFLASIYLRVPYWKDYDFQSDEERYILCGKDVCNTLEIAQIQARQLEAA